MIDLIDKILLRLSVKELIREKYSPTQPRAPKGDPQGGQWVDSGTGGGANSYRGLEIVDREEWDDGTVITWVKSPFKYIDKSVKTPTGNQTKYATEKTVRLSSLYASQKRVTQSGIEKPRDDSYGLPLVVKSNGIMYIQDGHHRLTRQFLDGDKNARVRFVDMDGVAK